MSMLITIMDIILLISHSAFIFANSIMSLSLAAPIMAGGTGISPIIFQLAIFVLAIFVGYYVVWSVTPALHTPLMAVTNAISSVIIVGALIAMAAGLKDSNNISSYTGFAAAMLCAINIFGGFLNERFVFKPLPASPLLLLQSAQQSRWLHHGSASRNRQDCFVVRTSRRRVWQDTESAGPCKFYLFCLFCFCFRVRFCFCFC